MGHYAAEMGYGVDDDTPLPPFNLLPLTPPAKSKKQLAAEKKERRVKVKKICNALKIKEKEFVNVIFNIMINGW